MKKYLIILAVFILLVGKIYAQQMSLDTIIERSARAVEEVLPQGTKVAVLNFTSTSETFSDYVIEEITGKLVMGRIITIVDRRNLELISQEMNLQLSGDVSDESAQAIGRMLGAQSIVSGTLTNMETFYRFRIRVINVETAAIQTQVSFDLRNDAQVAFLLGSGLSNVQPTTPGVIAPTIEGINVPGSNLTEKLAWLQRSADSHNIYILEVNANENISPHTFEYRGAINITIILRGVGANRSIRLRSHGNMFTIRSNVTFILDSNITLQGHSGNTTALINVNGGEFRMNAGSFILGNINTSSTESAGLGGGIRVTSGTFTMNGGTISGNTARGGGAVGIGGGGTFTMLDGTISGNTAMYGGGVDVNSGIFTMNGGTISGNKATDSGGGVGVNMSQTFTMRGGTITGNTAFNFAGGVNIYSANFNKIGGIITGYNTDQRNGNVVMDEAGNVLARRGHAVAVNDATHRKETTAGTGVNLSFSNNRASGGWDN
jgi:TolB-like protein